MVVVALSTIALVLSLLSTVLLCTEAHSWIDCIDTSRSKLYDQSAAYIFGGASGREVCEGHGAGYPGRGDIAIGPGYTYKMLKNEVEAGAPVCQTVDPNTYSDWRKRISLTPGQTTYFAYLPNGHIVKDKKAVGTQHGVYWTGQPGTRLASTHDMKPEHLINGHTTDFDDGNCGETVDSHGNPSGRAGDGKPCIGSFSIPAGTAPGMYNLVWYWTFWLDNEDAYKDQTNAKGYFGAAYSTCFEVEVTSDGSDKVPDTELAVDSETLASGPTPAPALTPTLAGAPMAVSKPALPPADNGSLDAGHEATPEVENEEGIVGQGTARGVPMATDLETKSSKPTLEMKDPMGKPEVEEASDEDGALSANIELASQSSTRSNSMDDVGSDIWDADEVGREASVEFVLDDVTQKESPSSSMDEDALASSMDDDNSASQSHSESPSEAKPVAMESAATSVKSIEQWVTLGFALLCGGALLACS